MWQMHPSIAPEQVSWRLSAGSVSWDEPTIVAAARRASWMDAEGFGVKAVELRHEDTLSVDVWRRKDGVEDNMRLELLTRGDMDVCVRENGVRFDWDDVLDLIVELTFPGWVR